MVVGEILYGILAIEPRDPTRAATLRAWLGEIEATHLVLPIDEPVIREWARLRTVVGREGDFEDMLIAATALAHGMTVVTRNRGDFEAFGVPTLSPWRGY
jgi:predicted nucleic acid-binding protein